MALHYDVGAQVIVLGLEELRARLYKKKTNRQEYWRDRISQLEHINQYLPVILRWHGLNPSMNFVSELQYGNIPVNDVVECIQELVDLSLLDDAYCIKDQYKTQLSVIANEAYQLMIRTRSSVHPDVITFYMSPNRLPVRVKPHYSGGFNARMPHRGEGLGRKLPSDDSNFGRYDHSHSGSGWAERRKVVGADLRQSDVVDSSSMQRDGESSSVIVQPRIIKNDANYKKVLGFLNKAKDRLSKMEQCTHVVSQLQAELSDLCRSPQFVKRCGDFIQNELRSGSFARTEDVIAKFKDLFVKLYLIDRFDSLSEQAHDIYDKYGYALRLRLTSVETQLKTYASDPASLSAEDCAAFVRLIQNAGFDEFEDADRFYDESQDIACSIDDIAKRYIFRSSAWAADVVRLYRSQHSSSAISVKTEDLFRKFNLILSFNLTDSYFKIEVQKYEQYVKDLVYRETVHVDTEQIYTELQSMDVEQLNKDKSGFRISALVSHGFKTIYDVWKAPVQSISGIKGISEKKAYEMKHKANEIATLVSTTHQHVEPLRINFDDHSDTVTEIIKAIYLYRQLLMVQEQVCTVGTYDRTDIERAQISVLRYENDASWLFLLPDYRRQFSDVYNQWKDADSDYRFVLYTRAQQCVVQNIGSVDAGAAWADFQRYTVEYNNCIERFVPEAFGGTNDTYGLPAGLAEQIDAQEIYPNGFHGTLRRYQEWGVKYILHQGRVLLGDEMGLGKTIQAIAAMVSLVNVGYKHFIVICPASVVVNWFKEVRNFSALQAYVGHGSARVRNDAVNAWKYHGGVLITNYETFSSLDVDGVELGIVVVDEAHYIKNRDASRSIHVRRLCARVDRVLFMTGTALENKVDEMLSLIEVLDENVAALAATYAAVTSSKQFQEAVAPVYFRRKQCDVNKELPEKIEETVWCSMSHAEVQAYEDVALTQQNPYMGMRRVSWMMPSVWQSTKAKRLREIVEQAVQDGRKVIVFSNFHDTLQKVLTLFDGQCIGPIDGSMSPSKRQEIIDKFSEDPALHVLVSQIQAGGTGLNIQSASVVVMCEPQVKPSIENQAIGRVHRMGQSRTVFVYRLCCVDSIDERMLEILQRKQVQFAIYADQSLSGAKSLELDDNDVSSMVAAEIERIKASRQNRTIQSDFSNTVEGMAWHLQDVAEAQAQYTRIENAKRARTITPAKRYEILTRDNFTCQKCGKYGPGAKDAFGHQLPEPVGGYATGLEVDHKTPFSLGGSDDDDNLWTLCAVCNRGKSNLYDDGDLVQ